MFRLFRRRPERPNFAAEWVPTHRHKKGGLYRVVAEGVLETDRSAVVIYDDEDGTVWVRPTSEFWDGRFTKLDSA